MSDAEAKVEEPDEDDEVPQCPPPPLPHVCCACWQIDVDLSDPGADFYELAQPLREGATKWKQLHANLIDVVLDSLVDTAQSVVEYEAGAEHKEALQQSLESLLELRRDAAVQEKLYSTLSEEVVRVWRRPCLQWGAPRRPPFLGSTRARTGRSTSPRSRPRWKPTGCSPSWCAVICERHLAARE